LALELAAARMRVLSPGGLLLRLNERLAYLTGGPTDAPARQQTLRATLDWSYELLPSEAQDLLARLSVFRGGFTVSAASAVCVHPDVPEVALLDGLAVLVDHSLMHRSDEPPHAGGDERFWMLEVVREYASERLAASGAAEELALRHAGYFLALAEQANAGLAGPEQPVWRAQLEAEISNLRAAMSWAIPENDPRLGLRLASQLGQRFWNLSGHYREDARWLELALASAPDPSRDRAQALAALAALIWRWTPEEACAYAEEAVALARGLGDPRLHAWCSLIRATAAHYRGDTSLAELRFRETGEMATVAGDREIAWAALNNRANLALGDADYQYARQLAQEALVFDSPHNTITLCVLACASVHLGHDREAISALLDAVSSAQQKGASAAGVLRACGSVIARVGSAERAARLLGHEEALREKYANALDPTDRRLLAEAIDILHTKLYPEVLASAWQWGRSMSTQDAFAEVLDELDDRQTNATRPAPHVT
jgi:tetratricopeptide (TPR) repeat protein